MGVCFAQNTMSLTRRKDCHVVGCGDLSLAKGLCSAHYQREKKGSYHVTGLKFKNNSLPAKSTCEYMFSDGSRCNRRHKANGFCGAHRMRGERGQDMDAPIRTKKSMQVHGCRVFPVHYTKKKYKSFAEHKCLVVGCVDTAPFHGHLCHNHMLSYHSGCLSFENEQDMKFLPKRKGNIVAKHDLESLDDVKIDDTWI